MNAYSLSPVTVKMFTKFTELLTSIFFNYLNVSIHSFRMCIYSFIQNVLLGLTLPFWQMNTNISVCYGANIQVSGTGAMVGDCTAQLPVFGG